jgi:integrase
MRVGAIAASLVSSPAGQSAGRPSRALTHVQAEAVLRAAEADRLHAYVVVSLLTGVRTEEARALTWEHIVAYDDDTRQWLPVSQSGWDHALFAMYVWRSVRTGGRMKTPKSRRSLALPARAVSALTAHQQRQDEERGVAAPLGLWEETGLVFASQHRTALDAHNVRRSFRRICSAAKIREDWTPRELRHTFVSIMSDGGMPIERIAPLVGHAGGSRVTEEIYRDVIRPAITEGAEMMDLVLRVHGLEARPRRPDERATGDSDLYPADRGEVRQVRRGRRLDLSR